MSRNEENKDYRCSFCGKSHNQVRRLIAGPDIYICDECVKLRSSIIDEEFGQTATEQLTGLLKPVEIKAILDEYVIGQDNAKKSLAVAVYNHYKRIHNVIPNQKDSKEVELQNLLLL